MLVFQKARKSTIFGLELRFPIQNLVKKTVQFLKPI